ncbi:MAG: NYN domain-containing protein [Flavisolibacter sp.]
MTHLTENRIAVFVDAENVSSWIKHDGITMLVEELMQLGQIIIRRAYGVWSRPQLAAHQAAINQQGFELIHCYHPVTGKNTADIQMTVDVIECAWQLPNISCFVLVTGDSDFSPVFRRLRAMGKDVIGVGQQSTLSECVKTSCTRFIYTNEYLDYRQQLRTEDNASVQETLPVLTDYSAVDTVKQLAEANEFVMQLLKAQKDGVNTSQLKNALKAQTGFDEKNFNFASFSQFLTAIDGITLTKVGSANYAVLATNGPVIATENLNPATAEYYSSLLKKQNLRLISADKIKRIYKQATAIKEHYSEMTALKEAVFAASHKVDGQLAKADVNKAFNLFVKMDLIQTEKAKGDIDAIKVKKMPLKDFLLKLDKLMIASLLESRKVSTFPLKAAEVKKLTISPISKDAIKKLIA